MADDRTTWGSAPPREWRPRPAMSDTPVPARTFYDMVHKYEHEIAELRDEVAAARAELHEVKGDLRRVLSILDARAKADTKFREHLAKICTAFAEDGKVRLVLVAGVILLGLVLAGVTGLSYRDGGLTIDASENLRRVGQDEAAPLR